MNIKCSTKAAKWYGILKRTMLKDLHWLFIIFWVQFKILVLIFKIAWRSKKLYLSQYEPIWIFRRPICGF